MTGSFKSFNGKNVAITLNMNISQRSKFLFLYKDDGVSPRDKLSAITLSPDLTYFILCLNSYFFEIPSQMYTNTPAKGDFARAFSTQNIDTLLSGYFTVSHLYIEPYRFRCILQFCPLFVSLYFVNKSFKGKPQYVSV